MNATSPSSLTYANPSSPRGKNKTKGNSHERGGRAFDRHRKYISPASTAIPTLKKERRKSQAGCTSAITMEKNVPASAALSCASFFFTWTPPRRSIKDTQVQRRCRRLKRPAQGREGYDKTDARILRGRNNTRHNPASPAATPTTPLSLIGGGFGAGARQSQQENARAEAANETQKKAPLGSENNIKRAGWRGRESNDDIAYNGDHEEETGRRRTDAVAREMCAALLGKLRPGPTWREGMERTPRRLIYFQNKMQVRRGKEADDDSYNTREKTK